MDEDEDAGAADADLASFSGDLATGASLCVHAGYVGQPAVLAESRGALRLKFDSVRAAVTCVRHPLRRDATGAAGWFTSGPAAEVAKTAGKPREPPLDSTPSHHRVLVQC